MDVAELASIPLFEGLTDEQLGSLVSNSSEETFSPGEVVFHEGAPGDAWWVMLAGNVELVRRMGREEVVVSAMNAPGRWAGGFRAWDEHGTFLATGRAVTQSRLMRVPAEVLRSATYAWFPLGGHLIEGLYRTARSIESTARQRDSLVTLGTLAAGLAHELNNPAAAATRAVASLEETCASLLGSLGSMAAAGLTPPQFAAVDALRRELHPLGPRLDPLDVADREDEISSCLAQRGVEGDDVLAAALAPAGADVAWCRRAGELLGAGALEAGLTWVASSVTAVSLLAEVKDSTHRISELVSAMRSYSQLDRASVQLVDVTEGLDATLLMLGHKLRDGITVVRDYADDVPKVQANPGELNQVWTNLIDNAIDAMAGEGTLRVSTRAADGSLVVDIGDTGPGMPPEVAGRAFDAFFTTKPVGEGTGLGLDIARRIVVERHGGAITIDSGPRGTVIRVALPLG